MKGSISNKVTTILTASVVFILLISGLYYYFSERKIATDNLHKMSVQTVERIAHSLAFPLWTLDIEEINRIIMFEMMNENITGILVRDMDENVYSGMVKRNSGVVVPFSDAVQSSLRESTIKSRWDIIRNKDKIGTVEVFFTSASVNKYLKGIIVSIVSQMIVTAVVVILLLSWLFDRYIIKRIIRIRDGINQIEGGNYAVNIEVAGMDELSYIAESINNMAWTVLSREQDLIKSNNEIRLLQHYLANIIESMPSMLISLDRYGIVTQWNTAAIRLTGIDAGQAIGKKIWELIPGFAEFKCDFEETIRTHNPRTLLKRPFTNGEKRYFDISIFPLVADSENGAVFRLDDVTEIEHKEEQLRQAQKMETVGTLAGGLAHDFNNVLGGIIGTLSVLQYRIKVEGGIGKDQLKKYLDTIGESAGRAADIVQQLLVLSRKREISFEPVNIMQAIGNTLKICENTFDKSVEIRTVPYRETSYVRADPIQIEQVLLNLFVNGYHAMMMREDGVKPGGILTVSVEKIFSDTHFINTHPEATAGDYWEIIVQDTGMGIEKRNISKIFDPFFTTKEKGKGTGLGLAVAYNIIHQHGGFMDVYSEIGIGTSVHVYLPVLSISDPVKESVKDEVIYRGEGKILLIDDDSIMRETAREILEECGYEVIEAADGEEGVELFSQQYNGIRAVLLDMVMPRKSGKTAYLEMKEINKDIRVILSSGFKQDEQVNSVLNLGVQGFIQKPYTLGKLSKIVFDVLNDDEKGSGN